MSVVGFYTESGKRKPITARKQQWGGARGKKGASIGEAYEEVKEVLAFESGLSRHEIEEQFDLGVNETGGFIWIGSDSGGSLWKSSSSKEEEEVTRAILKGLKKKFKINFSMDGQGFFYVLTPKRKTPRRKRR